MSVFVSVVFLPKNMTKGIKRYHFIKFGCLVRNLIMVIMIIVLIVDNMSVFGTHWHSLAVFVSVIFPAKKLPFGANGCHFPFLTTLARKLQPNNSQDKDKSF